MKTLSIAFYELKKLFRNRRLMAIIVSQPIVIALIVGLVADHDPNNIKVGLVQEKDNVYSQSFENNLRKSDSLIIEDYSEVNLDEIKAGKLRAFVQTDFTTGEGNKGEVEILDDPAGSMIKYIVDSEVAEAVKEVSLEMAKDNADNQIKTDLGKIMPQDQIKLSIDGKLIDPLEVTARDASPFKLKRFDYFASGMMVLLILLVVLNISGISITTERVKGTFERLFVTPYGKLDVIFGKALAHTLIGIFVAFVGVLSLHLMFSVSLGSIYLIILINFMVVMLAVTLGLLISSITYSVVESVQLAMYVFFVSVLTVAIFSPIEGTNKYLAHFMKVSPFYYAVDASRRVNMDDAGWAQIANNVYILIGFFFLFLVLSIILLRREAK